MKKSSWCYNLTAVSFRHGVATSYFAQPSLWTEVLLKYSKIKIFQTPECVLFCYKLSGEALWLLIYCESSGFRCHLEMRAENHIQQPPWCLVNTQIWLLLAFLIPTLYYFSPCSENNLSEATPFHYTDLIPCSRHVRWEWLYWLCFTGVKAVE